MILLLGGTSETAAIAEGLADAGLDVLVSTATDEPLDVGGSPRISRRSGPLDLDGMIELGSTAALSLIVDATHPYAAEAHRTASGAARALSIPLLRWDRPPWLNCKDDSIFRATTHEQAASLSCSFGGPVFAAIGAKHLRVYAEQARKAGVDLTVRVLPGDASVRTALEAGIKPERIITGRGPFSLDDNLAVLRNNHIRVMVTKDSGEAGGVPAKIQAAQLAGCVTVVVNRPEDGPDRAFRNLEALIQEAVTLSA